MTRSWLQMWIGALSLLLLLACGGKSSGSAVPPLPHAPASPVAVPQIAEPPPRTAETDVVREPVVEPSSEAVEAAATPGPRGASKPEDDAKRSTRAPTKRAVRDPANEYTPEEWREVIENEREFQKRAAGKSLEDLVREEFGGHLPDEGPGLVTGDTVRK